MLLLYYIYVPAILQLCNNFVTSFYNLTLCLFMRRGEMFLFMHRQMLARYNTERIALGLPLVEAFNRYTFSYYMLICTSNTNSTLHLIIRPQWSQPLMQGYDSRLTQATGTKYLPRPPGMKFKRWAP